MLRLPAALVEDISLRSGSLAALSLTCSALQRVLNQPETQLRFYLAAQRRRCLTTSSAAEALSCSTSTSCWSAHSTGEDAAAGFGPWAVYGLLACRARPRDAHGTLRLLQLMLTCSSMVQLVPAPQQAALQHMLAATSSSDTARALELLMTVLPHAQHCLLHFCASSGHKELVKQLLPRCTAPVKLHGVLHYVKTSAFLAAAAGGHVAVLSELLAAGASHWACQLPGASLTCSALDLAAMGGHMEAMQLLSQYVANPSPYFLTAAADSGSGPAMEWALQHWFAQFSALTAFSKAHVLQMHDALKVSCQHGHVSAVRQLLAALHRTSNDDCCVLALTYASSTSNTDAIQAVLDSPQLPGQLARGPKLLSKAAQAVASCMRIAILKHCRPALDTLLHSLTSSSSPISAVRPLLGPHMRFIFDQAAQSGNGPALQLLLLSLPEQYEALGVSALEAALSEGHADVAATIKTLLIMQGPDQGFAAAALSPEGNPGLAKASLHGAYKGAAVRGDIPALQHLLQQGPDGPDDNMQLLLLRLAAGAGREEAVRLLLQEFGNVGPRLEANLKAVCRGAVHAGQLRLLQALAADRPRSALLAHITSEPEALAEYLRAALLCDQVDVAAWLVLLAHEQQDMELVRSTLSSLLATSRWELLNAGRGIVMHEVVVDLLKHLAAHSLAAASSSGSNRSERSSDSSTGSAMSVAEPGTAAAAAAAAGSEELQLPQLAASPTAEAAAGVADELSVNAGSGSQRTAAQLCSLGRELLQPQLLGQLLHISQGLSPWRLLTVVELVDWWGLDTSTSQQQPLAAPEQAVQLPVPAAVNVQPQHQQAAVAAVAPASTAAGAQEEEPHEEQAQHHSSSEGSAALHSKRSAPRSSSGASLSSNSSGNDDSSVTSSSSGSGDASCDVLSPCLTHTGPGAGAAADTSPAAATTRLLPANSMEVGSLQSDDCQPTSTWLDDLMRKGPSNGSSAVAAAANTHTTSTPASDLVPAQAQPQQQQQHQLSPITPNRPPPLQLPPQQQQQQQQSLSAEHRHLDLGKEWGGSWQQLTGQVAQLHMASPQRQQLCSPTHPSAPVAKPRCSFDFEQHVVQQLRRRQQQEGRAAHLRRESAPGPSSTAATAARELRASLSQCPAQRSPVHPYMQQCSQGGQQHQHDA